MSEQKHNDGGPAFPVVAENGLGHVCDGMSKQEHKHTPGPWRTEHETSAGHDLWALYAGDRYIGHYTHYGDRHIPYVRPNRKAEANARLIAAAPELLGLLEEWTADQTECGCDTAACQGNCLPARSRAAIAKATGQEG